MIRPHTYMHYRYLQSSAHNSKYVSLLSVGYLIKTSISNHTFGKTSSKGNTNTVSNGSNNTVFFQHFCTKNPKASTPFLVHEPQSLKICGLPESQGSPANCLKWGSEAYLLLSLDVDGTLVLPALTRVAKKLLFFLDSLILKHDLKEFHYRISIKFSLYNMTHTRTHYICRLKYNVLICM